MQQFIFVISELVSIANFCNMFFGNTFYEKKISIKKLDSTNWKEQHFRCNRMQ
jgi:hypothetical protein